MDPVTAFQVAGTVITFLEFGRSLMSDAKEVYRSPSGATSRAVKLTSITDDLRRSRDHIMESLEGIPVASPTNSDKTLVKICERCDGMEIELQKALEGLQARGETRFDFAKSSVAVAFKSMWSQSKIDDLERRLRETQLEVAMAVLMSLWEHERIHGKPRQEMMETILASISRTDQKVDQLMQDLFEASSDSSPEGASKRSTLFHELWEADWKPDLDTIGRLQNTPSNEMVAHLIQQDIVKSLWFASIESRDRKISETYKSTYQWILDPHGSTKFVPWMEKNEGVPYWITGKAGSGKSTLMKYLVHHRLTMLHLQKWAGELPVLFSHFYFWDATRDDLQHSKEGLIRTLLWQCLNARPELVQKVAPRRWAAYNAFRGWEGPVPEWSREELQETFQHLVSLNNTSFRLALFIDGLDEFEGEPVTMIQWIKDMVTKFSVKLCVGSRPWTAFSDAFDQYPSLTMQTLTAPDIRLYIDGYLTTSRAFSDWKSILPVEAEALRQGLIQKAGGVFLWVYIVIKELMRALQSGKNLQDLDKIVDSLPTDMMQLYTKIYASAEAGEAKRAALYFTLLRNATHRLKSYELWYIEESHALDPNDKPAWTSMQRQIARRLDSSTRGMIYVAEDIALDPSDDPASKSRSNESHLDSSTEGVVEVAEYPQAIVDGYIEFHHRTAKEWLSQPEMLPVISAHLPEHFDARLLLMKGYRARTAQVLKADKEYLDQSDPNDWYSSSMALSSIFEYASQVAESPILTPALIEELEVTRETLNSIAEVFKVSQEDKLRTEGNQEVLWEFPLRPRRESRRRRVRLRELQTASSAQANPQEVPMPRAKKKGKIEHSTTDSIKADVYEVPWLGMHSGQVLKVVLQFWLPNLLEEKNDRISLLHGVIFGSLSRQLLSGGQDPVDYRLRLRLIEGLLDCGASVRGRSHAPQFNDNDEDLYYLDMIQKSDEKLLLGVGPEEYWDEVRRLLTKRRRGTRFRQLWKAVMYTNL